MSKRKTNTNKRKTNKNKRKTNTNKNKKYGGNQQNNLDILNVLLQNKDAYRNKLEIDNKNKTIYDLNFFDTLYTDIETELKKDPGTDIINFIRSINTKSNDKTDNTKELVKMFIEDNITLAQQNKPSVKLSTPTPAKNVVTPQNNKITEKTSTLISANKILAPPANIVVAPQNNKITTYVEEKILSPPLDIKPPIDTKEEEQLQFNINTTIEQTFIYTNKEQITEIINNFLILNKNLYDFCKEINTYIYTNLYEEVKTKPINIIQEYVENKPKRKPIGFINRGYGTQYGSGEKNIEEEFKKLILLLFLFIISKRYKKYNQLFTDYLLKEIKNIQYKHPLIHNLLMFFKNRVVQIGGTCWISSFFNIVYLTKSIRNVISSSNVYQNFKIEQNKLNKINNFDDLIFKYIRDVLIVKNEGDAYNKENFQTPEKIYTYFSFIENHNKIKSGYLVKLKYIVAFLFYLFIEKEQKLKKENGDFFLLLAYFINYTVKNYKSETIINDGGLPINCVKYLLSDYQSEYYFVENQSEYYFVDTNETKIFMDNINKKLFILHNSRYFKDRNYFKTMIETIEKHNFTLVASELRYLSTHCVAGLIYEGQKVILDSNNYIDFYDWTKEDDKIGNFHPELLFFIKND